MGKSVKIRRLNELCKAKGLGRFYKGRGRLVKRDLSGGQLDYLLMLFSLPAGSIVHDCDGFNHIVKGLAGPYRLRLPKAGYRCWRGYTKTEYWYDDQLEFSDIQGRLSCGCPMGLEPARSREDIEGWMKGFLDYYVPRDTGEGFITKRHRLMYEALQSGEHICDERGIMLEAFKTR